MFWDNKYRSNERVWGKRPNELAVFAVKYLQEYRSNNDLLSILDIGCGYGRDIMYFSKQLRCSILGIDISEKAIDMARKTCHKIPKGKIKFCCCNFTELDEVRCDVVFVANFYHLLRCTERERLRKKIKEVLKPGGLLFLNTLSINDPEEYGKGVPVSGESHSFQKEKYLHFFTGKELKEDFNFLVIKELYEHKYDEPHVQGKTHHHISWILVGEYARTSIGYDNISRVYDVSRAARPLSMGEKLILYGDDISWNFVQHRLYGFGLMPSPKLLLFFGCKSS